MLPRKYRTENDKAATQKQKMDHKQNKVQIYYPLSMKNKKKPPKKLSLAGNHDYLAVKNIINIALVRARMTKNHKHGRVDIIKLLDYVIPQEYFGTTRHRKILYMIVKKILTRSNYECIYLSTLTKGFDYQSIPWLTGVPESNHEKYFLKCNLFILNSIVKPLIHHYYCSLKTFSGHEVKLIERSKWQSFCSKAINNRFELGHLLPRSNVPRHLARGVLLLVPKDDCKTLQNRPIISIFPDPSTKIRYKHLSMKIYKLARTQNKLYSASLFNAWREYLGRICNLKLYAVKVDIADAFGNVDTELLKNLIVTCSEEYLSEDEKKFVIHHIENQYVVLKAYNKKRSVVCEWKHGLVQGDRLSSCLCELYMAFLDRIHLSEFKPEKCFLHRTVDDFIFCSTEEHLATRFLNKIKSVYILNENKTTVIFNATGNTELSYYGYILNIETKEVRQNFNFRKGEILRHKFKLWNPKCQIPERNGSFFIKRALMFCFNNNNFNKICLNTIFNSEGTALKNFFDGMLFLAFKFDAVFMAIRDSIENVGFVFDIIQNTIREYSNRVLFKFKSHRGVHDGDHIHFNLLKSIGYKAFVLVMKKRSAVYRDIIRKIHENENLFLNLEETKLASSYFNSFPRYFENVSMKRVPKVI